MGQLSLGMGCRIGPMEQLPPGISKNKVFNKVLLNLICLSHLKFLNKNAMKIS